MGGSQRAVMARQYEVRVRSDKAVHEAKRSDSDKSIPTRWTRVPYADIRENPKQATALIMIQREDNSFDI